MSWFDILKVEDIAFVDDKQGIPEFEGFGEYSLSNRHSTTQQVLAVMMEGMEEGKRPEMKKLINEKIRINQKNIYRYLKRKLGKEPTEKQITEYVIRTIMHEATHAGMGLEQHVMNEAQQEYGAFTGQFPQNTYYRLKTFLQHPQTEKRILHPMFDGMGIDSTVSSEKVKLTKELLMIVDALTDEIKPKSTMEKVREKLTRLEITARTQKPRESFRGTVQPSSINDLTKRYGEEHRAFLQKVLLSNIEDNVKFDDTELKMAATVTTTSSPAMFNKVVRRRKKKRDD